MFRALLIPWFKLHAWSIPLPVIEELKIQPFGLLVAIGILVGSRVAEWHGERNDVPRQAVADFLVYTIVIGLISAYFLNAAFYKPDDLLAIIHDPSLLKDKYLGLSSYGGFLGGVGAALWFRQRKRMSIFVLGDIWCFAFPFAWFFGRMGCFVVHDHPGLVSDFFLAVDNYNLQGQPRHDLGLYEVIWSAGTVGLFLFLGKKKRPFGFYMGLLPLLYAPIRFFLDYLRETPAHGGDVRYYGLTPGQYASILFTVVGAAVMWRALRGPAVTLMLDGSAPPSDADTDNAGEKPRPGVKHKPAPAGKRKRK
ncbi:MAG: prolipoprotein diacylglyceryl transferase [Myxococcales bacterium]